MAGRGARAREAGQAAVEHIGLVLVVALLLSAAGVWLVGHARPGAGPPPVVDRIVAPLDRVPAIPDLGVAPRRGRFHPLARALRRAVGVGRAGGGLVATGAGAFAAGFTGGLRSTVDEFVRDPVGALTGSGQLAAAAMRDPLGLGAGGLRAAIDYARELRSMPPAAAYRRFMHDLGGAGADLAVARGRGLARKALLRVLRGRLEGAAGAPSRETSP